MGRYEQVQKPAAEVVGQLLPLLSRSLSSSWGTHRTFARPLPTQGPDFFIHLPDTPLWPQHSGMARRRASRYL